MAQGILVQCINGKFITTIIEDSADLVAFMEARGFRFAGISDRSRSVREELWGEPEFENLIGPMWGGDETPLRYEDQAAYDIISR